MATSIMSIRGTETKRVKSPKKSNSTATVSIEAATNADSVAKGIPKVTNHSTVESKLDHLSKAGL